MQVPIVCDKDTGTYCIDRCVERHELPGAWFSAAEIYALLSMQQLLAAFDVGGLLADHVGALRQRLLSMIESATDSADELARRIRILSAAARHYPKMRALPDRQLRKDRKGNRKPHAERSRRRAPNG